MGRSRRESQIGSGLLPFSYVGLLLGGFLHYSEGLQGRIRGWQAVNGVLWVGGIVVSVVQVVGLTNEGIDGRKGSKYPISDEVTDVAVMAGVYAVIMVLEIVLGFWRALRRVGRESLRSRSPQVMGEEELVTKYPSTVQ